MIGVGLALGALAIGLDKALSRNPGDLELANEFESRVRDLFFSMPEISDITDMDQKLVHMFFPCRLELRQELARAKDLLNDVRAVTRHRNFTPREAMKAWCESRGHSQTHTSSGAVATAYPRLSACQRSWENIVNDYDNSVITILQYEDILKKHCPMTWDPSQDPPPPDPGDD